MDFSNINGETLEPESLDISDLFLTSSDSNQDSLNENWKTIEDTKRKISEMKQDIATGQANKADRMFKKWDENIRG